MEQRLKDLLSNLGRRTLRGVKPCPKCGTYNGTRGFSCKNKSCDVVFKAADDRKKKTTEACRIFTENQNAQVFSVRLRDKGPDYRDFVQLTSELIDSGGNISTAHNAQCFVESCSQKNDSFSLPNTACQHIQATLNCHAASVVLPIKTSLIPSLNIPLDFKDELWNMATEDNQGLEIHIVQRVSKTNFVVKTMMTAKFPLGYLHCGVYEARNKSGDVERKFVCSCRKMKTQNLAESLNKECVHFYACILAFISDEKFMTEFSHLVQASNVLSVALDGIDDISNERLVVHFEVMPQLSDEADLLCSDVRVLDSLVLAAEDGSGTFTDDSNGVNLSLPVGISMSDFLNGTLEVVGSMAGASVVRADDNVQIQQMHKVKTPSKRTPRKLLEAPSSGHNDGGIGTTRKISIAEDNPSMLLFDQWLASVTEQINQTMHYGMPETPAPLVYTIPHSFFDCLRERLSSSGRKKRLPNSTVVFQRNDRPPFATLTRYTWHLTNAVHLKQIFDTSTIQLELVRSFVENHDGSYDVYVPKAVDVDATNQLTDHCLPVLKPLELRTFLKIGQSESEASTIPFTLEWIPDILAQSKFGELTIHFQFGHQRHPAPASSVNERNGKISTKGQSNSSIIAAISSNFQPRRKKLKLECIHDVDAKDLQNLRLDFEHGVAPLNETEFQELTKSVP